MLQQNMPSELGQQVGFFDYHPFRSHGFMKAKHIASTAARLYRNHLNDAKITFLDFRCSTRYV